MNNNEQISKLNKIDLLELLNYLYNYKLYYRNNLNIKKSITIGVEIEYENENSYNNTIKFLKKYNWKIKGDRSVRNGHEICSPIMRDEEKYWNELKEICKYLKCKNVTTMCGTAGGHIHIGGNIFDKSEENLNFFKKCYALYENVLFRFFYGEKINIRKNAYTYAKTIGNLIYKAYNSDTNTFDNAYINDRYQSVNFNNLNINNNDHYKNTIEFRAPNGTLEEVIWQNNINVIIKMILSCINRVDKDFINYQFNNFKPFKKIDYNEVNLKQALEFSDLFFDNLLDKLNFLKQYIKDFDTTYGKDKELILARKMVE